MKFGDSMKWVKNHGSCQGGVLPYFLFVVGLFFVMAVVLWLTRDEARPPEVGAARASLRAKNLAEVRSAGESALTSYAIVNADEHIYQIPVARAMEIMIREWEQPEEALQMLAERVDLATAVPPTAPEVPSEFE
ncbi:MAG: hypothetical protein M2R45_02699 [Verrucomicrobia subdivision 3 bacterium]|nr:hypothetical protein [Limisphaerales bacterium]MCS1415041.1 hypothetical protein [Limisphaerales bacterium]